MRNNTINMIPAGALDLSADAASSAIFVGQDLGLSIQAVWTGSPVGSFKIQVSNDQGPAENSIMTGAVANWSDYTGSAVSAGGTSGNWMWDLPLTGVRWVRLVFTSTSGTGSLTSVQLSPKG